MNRTHFEHAAFALAMQIPFILAALAFSIPLLVWAGCLPGIFFFLGREHAQREYKIGDPSRLAPWAALDFWRWSLDAKLDLLLPIAAVSAAALAQNLILGK